MVRLILLVSFFQILGKLFGLLPPTTSTRRREQEDELSVLFVSSIRKIGIDFATWWSLQYDMSITPAKSKIKNGGPRFACIRPRLHFVWDLEPVSMLSRKVELKVPSNSIPAWGSEDWDYESHNSEESFSFQASLRPLTRWQYHCHLLDDQCWI